MQYKLNGHN